jgi:hypothetical protein
MNLLRRSPAEGEPQLVAELTNARDRLAQVQRAAEIEMAAARAEVVAVQGRVDEFGWVWSGSRRRLGASMRKTYGGRPRRSATKPWLFLCIGLAAMGIHRRRRRSCGIAVPCCSNRLPRPTPSLTGLTAICFVAVMVLTQRRWPGWPPSWIYQLPEAARITAGSWYASPV